MARGKKYKKALELITSDAYSVKDAVELLEKTNIAKFDSTTEVHFNLNLDPKYSDQIIRTTITLPNGSGKTSRICAFTDENVEELKKAGAAVA
ncbi:MAG: hypothetical protein LBC61_03195 [Candidatus Peribacteria bacterium]|jgi:large subunit ribosomal protein L1|nr:hypothetical protein [Candidatus Peribacteria bacterium]